MPTYEYECEKCGKQIEIIQKMDDPAPLCEEDKVEMKKLISLCGVRTKGAGLYSYDPNVPDNFGNYED